MSRCRRRRGQGSALAKHDGRACAADREPDDVHQRAHHKDAESARSALLPWHGNLFVIRVEAASQVLDFDPQSVVVESARQRERSVDHVTVLGRIVARFADRQADVENLVRSIAALRCESLRRAPG